jgi:hypothetical protein
MAKANHGRRGHGNSGGGTRGRAFAVLGRKKRKPGRPRKVRRPLTAAFIGARQARAREPELVDVDDIEEVSGAVVAPKKE